MVLRLFIETGSRFSVKKKKLTVTRHMNSIARMTSFATENHFAEDIIPINYQLTSHAPRLVQYFARCVKAVL